jgi:lysophospholipase L1-like esterase
VRRIRKIALWTGVIIVLMVGCASLKARQQDTASALVWEGDSQSAPAADLAVPAEVGGRSFPGPVHVYPLATKGADLDLIASRAAHVDALRTKTPGARNVLVVWAGTNDLGLGEDPAAVVNELGTYAKARRQAGWTVIVLTALPRTYALDVPGYEARRLAFNDQVRQLWPTFADRLVDVAALPEIGDDGDQRNPALFLPDTLHLNSAGRTLVGEKVGAVLAGV